MAETMWRKLLAGVLALVLALSFIPAVPLTAEAADIIPSTSLSGLGTAADPFQIATAADLAYMRNQVNAGGTITPSGGGDGVTAGTANYRLTADIFLGYWRDDNSNGIVDAGEIYDSASGGTAYSASNWTPIGSSSTYAGTFDGADHTVSGIYINATSDYQGLFGYVGGGTVKDVGVKDSYIKGGSNVGGIAGDIAGSKGTIQNSYNTGSVSGTDNVGGMAGSNYGTIQHCYNTGSISGVNNVGGVVGYNYGSSVYSAYSSVQNSYNTGSISGTANVGGVAGSNSGTVTGCYYDKQMCPAGGINGGDIGESAEGKLTEEMTLGTPFSGWSSGETGTWNFTAGLYPRLTGYVDADTDYKMDETAAALVSAAPVFLPSPYTAAGFNSDFTLSTANGVNWSSSDGSVISISGGNATVKSEGSVTLTASRGGVTKSITLKVDLTPPTLQSAVRNSNTQIMVTLSEPCLNLTKENDGGFTVTKTGTEETFAVSETAQGSDASKVVLTVADMATAGATGVTVTYSDGGNGIITDIAGNELATDSIGVVIPSWAINAASVTITAPAAGAAPQTAAQVEEATANADYTVTNVVWNEALTAGGKFKAGQVYTATVTLTSKNGKEFQAAPFTPIVESALSVDQTTSGSEIGNTVTFTVTFAATEAQSVTAVAVKTQPAKLIYTAGEPLDLTELVVTLTYNDGSTADIPYDQFGANSITANPDQGTAMEIAAHNGQSIILTCNAHTATTGNLTVNPAIITEAGVTGITNPVAGAAPIAAGSLTAGHASYTVTGLIWQNSDDSAATLTAEGKFKAASTYQAVIELTAAADYKFQALTPTVNAGTAGAGNINADAAGNKLTFKVNFDSTAAKTVAGIAVTSPWL